MATPTATEMVQAALGAGHTTPQTGIEFIRETFRTEMRASVFGNLKSRIEQDASRATVLTSHPIPATKSDQQGAPMTRVDLARALKELLDAHGAEKVRGYIRLFVAFNTGVISETLDIVEALNSKITQPAAPQAGGAPAAH